MKIEIAETGASARFFGLNSQASPKCQFSSRSVASDEASLVRAYTLPTRTAFSKSARQTALTVRDERDFPSVREPMLFMPAASRRPGPTREKSAIKGVLNSSKSVSKAEHLKTDYQKTDMDQTEKTKQAKKSRDLLEIFKLKQKKFH